MLIVQHITAGFTQGLADWLARESHRSVRLAHDGERPMPATILLAPDGQQMLLDARGHIALHTGPVSELCPNADLTLGSVATALGNRAIGVS